MTKPTLDLAPQLLRVAFDDGKGCFVAALTGVEGINGSGPTWGDAVNDLRMTLQLHLETDASLAPRLANASKFSGRFSVRVPASTHRALDAAANAEGVSLNAYVSSILSERVGAAAGAKPAKHTASVVAEEALIAMAESENRDSVGTATRITYGVFHEVSPSIGLALAALLGDRVATLEGSARATEHYGKFAWRAHKSGYTALALVLWRRALRFQPDNVKSASAYGQVLYRLGRYQEALDPLSRASDRDGRLTYYKARLQAPSPRKGEPDGELMQRIAEIMKEWAYGNESSEEATLWQGHVADMERIPREDLRALLKELRTFAATYSRWK